MPELVNILRGEISLVGPRPLRMRYLSRYTPEQMRRHEVRPGLTGWAQINGRNAIEFERKFALDVWYVDHQSLALDLAIIILTLQRIFKPEGISEPGQATSEEWLGTPSARGCDTALDPAADRMEAQPFLGATKIKNFFQIVITAW